MECKKVNIIYKHYLNIKMHSSVHCRQSVNTTFFHVQRCESTCLTSVFKRWAHINKHKINLKIGIKI